jgi:GNAT superfamily N-acetyltransferase
MHVRFATLEDTLQIVELLKRSLGESLMPKTEAFWRWKHHENPFGKSPVLLAFEGELLVGVRAFMRWEWQDRNKIYKAVRAVDTATHPDYQGRGIFRMLTQQLVVVCQSEGINFIFNTPNEGSRPGYLKMGWRSLGRLPVFLRPHFSFMKKRKEFDNKYSFNSSKAIQLLEDAPRVGSDRLSTHQSFSYLNWRYRMNPHVQYYAFGEPTSYVIFFRLKPTRWGVEFRIADVLLDSNQSQQQVKKHLQNVVHQSGASIVTWSGPCPLWGFKLSIGPIVTYRTLSFHNSLSFDVWRPSLGDLEVF